LNDLCGFFLINPIDSSVLTGAFETQLPLN